MKWRLPLHSALTQLSLPHLACTCPRRAALIIHVYSIELLLMAAVLPYDLIDPSNQSHAKEICEICGKGVGVQERKEREVTYAFEL